MCESPGSPGGWSGLKLTDLITMMSVRDIMSTLGAFSTPGYHEYTGGVQYTGLIMSTLGDTKMHVGFIMSTHGISPHCTHDNPRCTEHPPVYSWYPPVY